MLCRGVYEIQAKAFIGRTTLLGPKLLVSIQADFLKPVSLTVDYDKNAVYQAGETLPGELPLIVIMKSCIVPVSYRILTRGERLPTGQYSI